MGTDGPTIDLDAADVARARAGDAAAFRRLVERHQHVVLGLLGTLLPRHADREDVAQDAFLAVWAHLPAFDPRRGAFVAWLLTIARNLARNRLRTTRRAERLRPVPPSDARPPASSDADPRIDAAVAALPDDQRAAFVLALVHGLPLETVALVEDVPEGTVKSRLSRAKERLRAALRDVLEKTP